MYKFILFCCVLSVSLLHVRADELSDTARMNVMLPDFELFAAKNTERDTASIHKIVYLNKSEIASFQAGTTASLLQKSGEVFVQQSQAGGGSPVIRGMEANRILLVVDDVRMNNAIYRSGHLQNIITVDPEVINELEIIYGPASVMYGSDAMGGVIHMKTIQPLLSGNQAQNLHGQLTTRFGTAAQEYAGHLDVNFGNQKIAAVLSAGFKHFGDLRQGSVRRHGYLEWGMNYYFAERSAGVDKMIANSNPLIQKKSGYDQHDVLAKIKYQPLQNLQFNVNLQYSKSGNINRYDRLTEYKGSVLRYADWHYGPQVRKMLTVNGIWTPQNQLIDKAELQLAYQDIDESRVSRNFGSTKERHQVENVQVYSADLRFERQLGANDLLKFGYQTAHNQVVSTAFNQHADLGTVTQDALTRYPDDGSFMQSNAIYFVNSWQKSSRFKMEQSIRFNQISLEANYTSRMSEMLQLPLLNQFHQQNFAVNGGLGFLYTSRDKSSFRLNLISGFRAPNVDDLGKINDSNPIGQFIILPNADLKPEKSIQADFGYSKKFFNQLSIDINAYQIHLLDVMVVRPGTMNGLDSIAYDGQKSAVNYLQNKNRARISGLEAGLDWDISRELKFKSGITFTQGKLADGEPLDHIPPTFGNAEASYQKGHFLSSVSVLYHLPKKLADYSPGGEDNLIYATPEGTPGWWILNLKTEFDINNQFKIFAAVENLLDRHYRYFASGISAAGRNFLISAKYRF